MRLLAVALVSVAFVSGAQTEATAGSKKRAPHAAPFSWGGFYIGAHVGGAWAQQDVASAPANAMLNQAPGSGDLDTSSFLGGVHAGYNAVLSPGLVAGIEGDFSGVDLDDSAADTNRFASGTPVGSGGISWARSQNWLASVRGRLGVALSPTALAYATGGVAWTNVDYSAVNAFIGGCPNCGIASSSGTETGFVAGGGLEIALDGNWLFRGEYLYYGFDDAHLAANFQSAPATPASTWSFKDLDVQTFRTGVGYKF